MNDRETVRRILAGETDLYEGLYRKWFDSAFAAANVVLRDTRAARGCAHDALASAFEKLARFDQSRSFGAWVAGFARVEAWRRRSERSPSGRLQPLDDLLPKFEPSCPGPEMRHDLAAEARWLISRLARILSPQDLALVVLVVAFDYSYEEIARRTGENPATLRSRVHRAICAARRHLRHTKLGVTL